MVIKELSHHFSIQSQCYLIFHSKFKLNEMSQLKNGCLLERLSVICTGSLVLIMYQFLRLSPVSKLNQNWAYGKGSKWSLSHQTHIQTARSNNIQNCLLYYWREISPSFSSSSAGHISILPLRNSFNRKKVFPILFKYYKWYKWLERLTWQICVETGRR